MGEVEDVDVDGRILLAAGEGSSNVYKGGSGSKG